jgi:FkbM family methyltransferase
MGRPSEYSKRILHRAHGEAAQVSETRTGSIKAAQWRPTVAPPESDLLGLSLRVARFGMRAARALSHRARFAMTRLARIKRNIVFPARNVLSRHKPLTVRVGDQRFFLVAEGAIAADTWSRSRFERHELDFMLKILQPGMTFFDVGANVGLYSLVAARKVAHGKVFSFEPCQWTYHRLLRNVELNGLQNVSAVRAALGEFSGQAILQLNAPGKDGLNTLGRPRHPDSEITGQETVPISTLDEFLAQENVSRVDVMKVDVEGAELSLFHGAKNLLGQDSSPLILYESDAMLTAGFTYHPVETMWLLERHGYSFFVIDSRTGRISIPLSGRAYDAMVIAAKPTHPSYATVEELAR